MTKVVTGKSPLFKLNKTLLSICFLECDNTHYGDDCATPCVCVTTNTQTCNNINGSCTCNEGWEGLTCADDIDECSTLTDPCADPLKDCNNTHGSFTCSCKSGYRINDNQECVGKFLKDNYNHTTIK